MQHKEELGNKEIVAVTIFVSYSSDSQDGPFHNLLYEIADSPKKEDAPQKQG